MKPWRFHWDRQLYKALEHQYQMGLENLNNNLTEIKIEASRKRYYFLTTLLKQSLEYKYTLLFFRFIFNKNIKTTYFVLNNFKAWRITKIKQINN